MHGLHVKKFRAAVCVRHGGADRSKGTFGSMLHLGVLVQFLHYDVWSAGTPSSAVFSMCDLAIGHLF